MRSRLLIVALSLLAVGACGEPPTDELPPEDPFLAFGPSFVSSSDVRRTALEASLVDPSNGYSQLRLQKYGGEWDALPVRNFDVRPITVDEIGTYEAAPFRRTDGDFGPVFEEIEWTHEQLLSLGRHAFHNFPLELSPRFLAALESDEAAEELGLWRHEGRVGGLVRVRTRDGTEAVASTCSTCHASVVDGELVDGRSNAAIDNDAMTRRLTGGSGSSWGPGAADVTPDGIDNPVAITDLRAIRHQSRLHWAATLYNSPEALTVRVETLMITSANEAMRPPREVAVALAYYLWSFAEKKREPDETAAGAELFERECASCHGTLDIVPIGMVGTDPAAGSGSRGTGSYRVPSLYDVGTRAQFLHQGRVESLEALFDPARLNETPGHAFGTQLPDEDRTALIEYLRTF